MIKKKSRSRSAVRKPDFKPSGILGKYENRKNGQVSLYSEPLDSAEADYHWRIYQFTENDTVSFDLCGKSFFVIGRESGSDIKITHESMSRQHAVVQFKKRGKKTVPFLIDLDSKKGTFLNDKKIEPARFVQLKNKDIVTFGALVDEFVLVKGEKITHQLI